MNERHKFEAWLWAAFPGLDASFDENGDYDDPTIIVLWRGWRARAALDGAWSEREHDMAMLIRRLVRQLRKAEPAGDHKRLSDAALDALKRWGLNGSVLRDDATPVVNDQLTTGGKATASVEAPSLEALWELIEQYVSDSDTCCSMNTAAEDDVIIAQTHAKLSQALAAVYLRTAQALQPLTDEQIVGILHKVPHGSKPSHHVAFARAIERAHGIGAQEGVQP